MKRDKQVTVDKVKYVIDQTGVSYEEAEKALHRNKGDKEKTARWIVSQRRTVFAIAGRAFIGLFFYKFIIKKRDKTFVNVPLWLVGIVAIIMMLGTANTSFYYFELEGAITLITVLLILVTLLSGCDVLISKKEYEAKIRLKNVQKKVRQVVTDDLEYEVKENEDGEYSIEVDE
ncbi:MAG: hypothetical protein JXQ23_11900 [Clostridia bacterium]|nr:hypothetical protein [Clostridia bacterium]